MKIHHQTTKDGRCRVIKQDNGVTVRLLEEPTAEYVAKLQPGEPEPEPRDPLAEIDQLKKELGELRQFLQE